jgi:CHASE2 domain-containing sensor protein
VSELHVRLFLSSPSDVRPERDRVVTVADRLNGAFEGVVRIEVIRWEDGFYSATRSFQEQIHEAVAGMLKIDILVCILWGRIGLKLNPATWQREDSLGYESGTTYEYETAATLSRNNAGVPEIYLFRKSASILYRAENAAEDIEQHETLEKVWKRWTQSGDGYNAGAFQMFVQTDEFEKQIEDCLRQYLERRGILVKGPVWDRRIKGSPFRGLQAFETSHSAVFFGRDAAITRITAKLRTARFLLIIGASGTGKSSLLRASLVPRIARPGVIPDIDLWRTAVVMPNQDTFLGLAEALAAESCFGPQLQEAGCTVEQLTDLLRQGGDAALAPIRAALASAAQRRATERGYDKPRPARLLLAIDQLERLFVEARPEDVEAFADFLRGMIAQNLGFVVAALRGDAYGSFQAVETFTALREAGATHDLLPPSVIELEEIVTRPVLACHPPLEFETAGGKSLAEVLVADAKGGDSLPLLQMTLEHLFQAEKARGDGVLRFSDYRGMDQAVTQVASAAFESVDAPARASMPALITAFAHDVALDPATGKPIVTLRPVSRTEFERGRPERKALIDAFLAHRLLTVEDTGGEIRIRPVHEALLRVWPEAVHVLTENETIIRVRRTLEPLVAHWTGSGQTAQSDFLLTSPALLAGAQQLVARLGDDVAGPMRDYIAASLAADTRRREEERLRRTAIMSATGGMSMRSIPYYRPLVFVLLALALFVRYENPSVLDQLRNLAFDTYQRVSPATYSAQLPVRIVDIDDQSLAAYGQWPWPRTRLSDLVHALAEHGAAAIVFDLAFSEPDRWSPEQYVKTLPADQAQQFASVIGTGPTNDQAFATTLQQTPSVIAVPLDDGQQAASTPSPAAPAPPPPAGTASPAAAAGTPATAAAANATTTAPANATAAAAPADGVAAASASTPAAAAAALCALEPFGKAGFSWGGNCPAPFIPDFTNSSVLPILAQAAVGLGAVTYVPDADNIVRRVGLIYRQHNKLVPSLAAEGVRVAQGLSSYIIISSNASGVTSFGAATGINDFDIGDLQIPTDATGAIELKYRQTNPDAYISAAAVLGNTVADQDISGKIIVVGTTAAGQVDLHPTPIDAAVPGVEIQAQAVENILGKTELVRPEYITAVEELIVLVIGAMLAVAMPRVSARALAVLGILVVIALVVGGWASYNYVSILIDPVYPTITLIVFVTVVTFHIYRFSEAQRGRIRRVFDPSSYKGG